MEHQWTERGLRTELASLGFIVHGMSHLNSEYLLLAFGVAGDPRVFQVSVSPSLSATEIGAALRAELAEFPLPRIIAETKAASG
jgi:hypothetical protein